jgi:hypothetical protein
MLALSRGHWRIEHACFHVKDDSFREDLHVLPRPQRGLAVGLLRSTALNLLGIPCARWLATAPTTARAEWSRRPMVALARLGKDPVADTDADRVDAQNCVR